MQFQKNRSKNILALKSEEMKKKVRNLLDNLKDMENVGYDQVYEKIRASDLDREDLVRLLSLNEFSVQWIVQNPLGSAFYDFMVSSQGMHLSPLAMAASLGED